MEHNYEGKHGKLAIILEMVHLKTRRKMQLEGGKAGIKEQ